MSTGLAVFDTTVQETNLWLRSLETDLAPCSRQEAYTGLRAVLHVLRDRLTVQPVMALSAQLPMLLRGVFLEGWQPQSAVARIRDPRVFAEAVAARLPPGFAKDPVILTEAVFKILAERLDPDEVTKLLHQLPEPLRDLWPIECRTFT